MTVMTIWPWEVPVLYLYLHNKGWLNLRARWDSCNSSTKAAINTEGQEAGRLTTGNPGTRTLQRGSGQVLLDLG